MYEVVLLLITHILSTKLAYHHALKAGSLLKILEAVSRHALGPIMLMIQLISVCRHVHSSLICMDWTIYAFLDALTEHIKMIQPEPV